MKAMGHGLALILLWTSPAHAHAFAMRYDLPLPLGYYLGGAGAAVLLTFVLAAVVMRAPRPTRREWSIPFPAALWLARLARLVAVALFTLALAAGLFGPQSDWDSNLLPVLVWIIWWVGLAFVCALAGDMWRVLDPWDAVARALGAVIPWSARPWPTWLDAWPGVILFLAFAWTELVWPSNAVPAALARAIAVYSLVTWTGMALFGRLAWQRHADPFALFFGWFGRFAPLAIERDRLVWRGWGNGLFGPPPSTAMTVFVLAMLATVGFDGLHETPFWDGIDGTLQRHFYDIGFMAAFGFVATHAAIKTLGLLLMPAIFLLVYLSVSLAAARMANDAPWMMARRFVASLVPIAVAYHLAHYLSYLLIQGQAILPLLSDPFGLGWNLFGTRAHVIDIGVIGAQTVWIAAVAAIIGGHAVSVLLAHRIALATWPNHRHARLILLPLTLLMVAYTMLSLWILAQPIVT